MSHLSDDSDGFMEPQEELDLKTCSVLQLPAVEIKNLNKGWTCGHCGNYWSTRNRTKMIHHLAQTGRESIKACPRNRSMPSAAEKEAYQYRLRAFNAGRNSRQHKADTIDNRIDDRHEAIVRASFNS